MSNQALDYRINQEAVREVFNPRDEPRDKPEGWIMGGAVFCWVVNVFAIIFMLFQIGRAITGG